MKLKEPSKRNPGFSMIELMVVVAIMAILAGFLIASLPGIMSRINRGKVETFIAELENGLSKYQIDNGSFPINEPAGEHDDASGVKGATVLYKHLSGDWDLNGEVDFDNNEKVYVPKLDYYSNRDSKEGRSLVISGEYMVIDSFGNPIRYLAEPPNIDPDKRKTYNPTYDIWSITDANPDNPDDASKYISNWQTQ